MPVFVKPIKFYGNDALLGQGPRNEKAKYYLLSFSKKLVQKIITLITML